MMRPRSFTLALVAVLVGGCQLGLGGEAFVAGSAPDPAEATNPDASVVLVSAEAAGGSAPDSPSASPDVTQPPAAVPDARTEDASVDAWRSDGLADARAADAAAGGHASADLDADDDVASDASSPEEGGDSNVGDVQARDAAAPCDLLSRCCQTLAVAPPLSISCYAGVAQADGGDSCSGLLANLRDAGLCP